MNSTSRSSDQQTEGSLLGMQTAPPWTEGRHLSQRLSSVCEIRSAPSNMREGMPLRFQTASRIPDLSTAPHVVGVIHG